MKRHGVHIKDVLPDSIAAEIGIETGDILLSINGEKVADILEYKYLITDEFIEIEIEKRNGEQWILEVEKDYDEDLGLVFEGIIDSPRSCHNKCIFCFIDQMPKGMRSTLYFKDDDTRLSFLQGNFVTLTNLKEEEIYKIIKYRISPINISVHTTDPELRAKMLNNKNAGKLVNYLRILKEGNIEIKAQIVLCPGVNDGKHLMRTISDLEKFYPELSCVAIVPVGLTKYRDGLFQLKAFDKASAVEVINQIELLQKCLLNKIGTRFVFLSDEFYLIAGREFPDYDDYEGFPQIENGVGLVSLFKDEVKNALSTIEKYEQKDRYITIITGEYASPVIKEVCSDIESAIKGLKIKVYTILNDYFGYGVKVAGLITGKDIINQLIGRDIGKTVFIPDCMLKSDKEVFLDDLSVQDIEETLNTKIVVCKDDGSDLVSKILSQ